MSNILFPPKITFPFCEQHRWAALKAGPTKTQKQTTTSHNTTLTRLEAAAQQQAHGKAARSTSTAGALCYAIALPGRESVFRAGFRPDSSRESFFIGPRAGRRPAGGPNLIVSRKGFGRNPARSLISGPESLLPNILQFILAPWSTA